MTFSSVKTSLRFSLYCLQLEIEGDGNGRGREGRWAGLEWKEGGGGDVVGKGLGDKKRWHRGFFSVGVLEEQQSITTDNT